MKVKMENNKEYTLDEFISLHTDEPDKSAFYTYFKENNKIENVKYTYDIWMNLSMDCITQLVLENNDNTIGFDFLPDDNIKNYNKYIEYCYEYVIKCLYVPKDLIDDDNGDKLFTLFYKQKIKKNKQLWN